MRNYTTQMDAARKGIITPEMKAVTAKDFIDVVRLHAEDGVDFVTLHCGITRKTIEQIRKPKHEDTCSMCGKFCAVRSMNKTLNNEIIDIL